MSFLGLPRRATPCDRCGWRYEGFHVCFDASKPCPGEGVIDSHAKKVKKKLTTGHTSEGRSSISRSVTERWDQYREENRARDEEMIELYRSGMSTKDVGLKFDISHQTVLKVLKREEANTGETIVRPRGLNLRHMKEVAGGFN